MRLQSFFNEMEESEALFALSTSQLAEQTEFYFKRFKKGTYGKKLHHQRWRKKECSGMKESGRPTHSPTKVSAKDNQQPQITNNKQTAQCKRSAITLVLHCPLYFLEVQKPVKGSHKTGHTGNIRSHLAHPHPPSSDHNSKQLEEKSFCQATGLLKRHLKPHFH